ncbi:MAG: dienelactone hydrolase family protein [Cyanobium sp.]
MPVGNSSRQRFALGGPPTLEELPRIHGKLLCFRGDRDPLMPPGELAAICAALESAGQPPLIVAEGAGHGFMCEARADFHSEAAAQGWKRMLALFAESLQPTDSARKLRMQDRLRQLCCCCPWVRPPCGGSET